MYVERFMEVCECPDASGLSLRAATCCHNQDRQPRSVPGTQRFAHAHAVQPRQAHIEYDEGGPTCRRQCDPLNPITGYHDLDSFIFERPLQHLAHGRLILNDQDVNAIRHVHASGSRTVKVVPMFSTLSTEMLPSCCSTIMREIARPMPVP